MKKIIAAVLCILLMIPTLSISASALSGEELSAPSAVLVETDSGKILFEKNKDEQRPCASITKVMTLLLVMEALDTGKIHLDDVVTTSAHAASMGGSDIWLEEGEQMTVDEMIEATAVASANDAAVALAEHIAGSEEDFVKMMNEKAQELGMTQTTFLNCNGLDEDGHLTSAYDVALMSRELLRHNKILDYSTIWLDTLRSGETQIVNTNKLLKTYPGITGLKTGTTSEAGSCISATAQRDDLSLVAVVLGAPSGKERFSDAASLLDYGFANFSTVKLSMTEELYPIAVEGGMQDTVDIVCEGSSAVTVPKGEEANVIQSAELEESLSAPVEKGQKAGTLRYTLNGETVASFDVVTADAVEAMTFLTVFSEVFKAAVKL